MACVVVLELKSKDGQADGLVQFFREILGDTRAYDGNISLELSQSQDDPTSIVVYEKWETKAQYERYLGWREENGSLAKIGEFLAAPPSIRYFDLTDA